MSAMEPDFTPTAVEQTEPATTGHVREALALTVDSLASIASRELSLNSLSSLPFPLPISPFPLEHVKDIECERAIAAEAAGKSGPVVTRENILFEDQWLLVINKPAGFYCEEVLSAVSDMIRPQDDTAPAFHMANRLDRDTSGVMIITKDRQATALMHKAFINRKVEKSYVALCCGELPSFQTTTVATGHGRSMKGAWRVYALEDVDRMLPNNKPVRDMETLFLVLGPSTYRPHITESLDDPSRAKPEEQTRESADSSGLKTPCEQESGSRGQGMHTEDVLCASHHTSVETLLPVSGGQSERGRHEGADTGLGFSMEHGRESVALGFCLENDNAGARLGFEEEHERSDVTTLGLAPENASAGAELGFEEEHERTGVTTLGFAGERSGDQASVGQGAGPIGDRSDDAESGSSRLSCPWGVDSREGFLMRAFPATGRTHQIRLHCQHVGASIVGDVKYGGPYVWRGRKWSGHALHAEKVEFVHPMTNVRLSVSAPLPEWAAYCEPPVL